VKIGEENSCSINNILTTLIFGYRPGRPLLLKKDEYINYQALDISDTN
jgi:hypothetical protein